MLLAFPVLRRLALAVLAAALIPFALARDAFVLLSGGGTPLTNNYSQYLQARALVAHLQATYPADSVWVFFGVGNREGEAPILADVRRQVKEDGFIRETWLPGAIQHNRPARKAEFLRALREEILPAVENGGTLHLFVGDHGTLTRQEPKESVITMWRLKPRETDNGWTTDQSETLSVTELRETIAAGLGKGRVIFCMTQCHSGGFHHLGLPRAVRPEPRWFVGEMPDSADVTQSTLLPIAGFTATDELSLAAGCDPDPDPDRWAGYERYVPENLLAVDLFTGGSTGLASRSFIAAHEAAVLVDQTIDKPRSTSERYLEQWAEVIERLAGEPMLAPTVKKHVAAYQKAVDVGLAKSRGRPFAAKRAQFDRYVRRMGEQNFVAAKIISGGSRAELEQAAGVGANRAGRPRAADSGPSERTQLWQKAVRPAWKAAVDAGAVSGLDGHALTFEKYLLAQEEEKSRDLIFTRGRRDPILNDIYWRSGYALPARMNPAKAEAVTRWGAERRAKIAAWARASSDSAVREAAEELWPLRRATSSGGAPPPRTLSAKIAAERTLFYRRVLAARAFLLAVKHTAALAELETLIRLEETPLPATLPVFRSAK